MVCIKWRGKLLLRCWDRNANGCKCMYSFQAVKKSRWCYERNACKPSHDSILIRSRERNSISPDAAGSFCLYFIIFACSETSQSHSIECNETKVVYAIAVYIETIFFRCVVNRILWLHDMRACKANAWIS